MHRLLFTGLFFLLKFSASAQQEDSVIIRKMATEILTKGKAYANLKTLTKSVGPRLSGSPQTYKAESWARLRLKMLEPKKYGCRNA